MSKRREATKKRERSAPKKKEDDEEETEAERFLKSLKLPSKEERERETAQRTHNVTSMLSGMRTAQPAVCEWLSLEEYILPKVVNNVYTANFGSEHFKPPLNMVRIAQYRPNTKYRPPNHAAITMRHYPTTALLFMGGNMVLIKTTSPGMALYYSHVYRQDLEQTPFILKVAGKPSTEMFVGTLEGRLGFSPGKMENIVGNGVLFQDGVHLTRLMEAEDEKVDWEPDAFPNAIYKDVLSDGTPFCANIASTGKIVLMGLKTREGLYEAYRIMSDVVYNFEDPNVPSNPKERYKYRINQLFKQNKLVAQSETDVNPDDLEAMGDEYDEDERAVAEDATIDALYSMVMQNIPLSTFSGGQPGQPVPPPQEPQEQDDGAETAAEDASMTLKLLSSAAESGLIDNVAFMLEQEEGSATRAVWTRDENGRTLADRLELSTDPRHRQIMHVIRDYMAQHPQM